MSKREQLLQALLAALNRVDGVELVERNRTYLLPENTASALVLLDGSIDGQTDRQEWEREPVFRMELTPEIWGSVRGSDSQVGTLRDALLSRTVQAVWTDRTLRELLDSFDGDLSIDGLDSFMAAKSASQAGGAFAIGFRIGFVFDPANP